MEEQPTQKESERVLKEYLSKFTPEQLAQLLEILDSDSVVQNTPVMKSTPRERPRQSESRTPASQGKNFRSSRRIPAPRRSDQQPDPRQGDRNARMKELPEEFQKRYTRRTAAAQRLLRLSTLVAGSRPNDEGLAALERSLTAALDTYQAAHRRANEVYLTDEPGATALWKKADNDLDEVLDKLGDRLRLINQLSEEGRTLLDRERARRRQNNLSESTAKRHEKVLEQHKENRPANELKKHGEASYHYVETVLRPYLEQYPEAISKQGTTCLMMVGREVVAVANSRDMGASPRYVIDALASFLPRGHVGARDLGTCAEPKAVATLLYDRGITTTGAAISWLRSTPDVACYCFNHEDLGVWKWIQPCSTNCWHWMTALGWKPKR